jgi:hypothetical protein
MLAAVFFWGIQCNELKEHVWMKSMPWRDVVEDVKWVFSELLRLSEESASGQD